MNLLTLELPRVTVRKTFNRLPRLLGRTVGGGELTGLMDDAGPQEEPMATVISRSAEELKRERKHLLRRAGLPERELRSRAETYQLTANQMDILDAIDNIDYLLNG